MLSLRTLVALALWAIDAPSDTKPRLPHSNGLKVAMAGVRNAPRLAAAVGARSSLALRLSTAAIPPATYHVSELTVTFGQGRVRTGSTKTQPTQPPAFPVPNREPIACRPRPAPAVP